MANLSQDGYGGMRPPMGDGVLDGPCEVFLSLLQVFLDQVLDLKGSGSLNAYLPPPLIPPQDLRTLSGRLPLTTFGEVAKKQIIQSKSNLFAVGARILLICSFKLSTSIGAIFHPFCPSKMFLFIIRRWGAVVAFRNWISFLTCSQGILFISSDQINVSFGPVLVCILYIKA